MTRKKKQKGNGVKEMESVLMESISESELNFLHSLRREIDSMKDRQAVLSRDLTLISADIIRKSEEMKARIREIEKKYELVKGQRELDFKTGAIMPPPQNRGLRT